ncbi:hypothetical protein KSP40_PGU010793 [Platanthera guangdongensis]|uniref:Uncharacterized protein n=1 Tax=Platanthera guangdongensis TaxID=2320717 RepID=A0ABR2LDV9_9ASPA
MVIEPPFYASIDVSVVEDADCFRFVIVVVGWSGGARARAIQIYLDVMKIVIMDSEVGSGDDARSGDDLFVKDLKLDRCQFWLPPDPTDSCLWNIPTENSSLLFRSVNPDDIEE